MVGGFLQPALICKRVLIKALWQKGKIKTSARCKANLQSNKHIFRVFWITGGFYTDLSSARFPPALTSPRLSVKSERFISSSFHSVPALDDITWHSLSCLIFQPVLPPTLLQSSLIRTCRIQFWPISCCKFRAGSLSGQPGPPDEAIQASVVIRRERKPELANGKCLRTSPPCTNGMGPLRK